MDSLTAFAAIGLAAVSWDGRFTQAGTRAFRHALDYREPFCQMPDAEMITLLDPLTVIDWPFQALETGDSICREI